MQAFLYAYTIGAVIFAAGLYSAHALIGAVTPDETGRAVQMGPGTYALVVPAGREGRPIRVEQLY